MSVVGKERDWSAYNNGRERRALYLREEGMGEGKVVEYRECSIPTTDRCSILYSLAKSSCSDYWKRGIPSQGTLRRSAQERKVMDPIGSCCLRNVHLGC